MLTAMTSTYEPSSLVSEAERLGWTRFGSPGILGMPATSSSCSPAYPLPGESRQAAGYPANFTASPEAQIAGERPATHPRPPAPGIALEAAPAQAAAEQAMAEYLTVWLCSGCGKSWVRTPPKSHKNAAQFWCHETIFFGRYELTTAGTHQATR